MKSPRGFTLIETLVAVTIAALAVAGPLYVANRALVATHIAKDQLTAAYLAQEAIEYVRGMRDFEFLYAYRRGSGGAVSEEAWAAFVHNTGGSGRGSIALCTTVSCVLDPSLPLGSGSSGAALTPCASACPPLYVTSTGRYTLAGAGNTSTPFTRSVRATLLAPDDMQVTSTVTWTNRGTPYTMTVTDHLTPWQ